jgi:hypothetical protein
MPKRYASPMARLLANSRVVPGSSYNGRPCRLWTGAVVRNRDGTEYGKLSETVRGKHKTWLAHRWVIVRVKGRRLRADDVGKHLCNTPLCCEPDHLVGGTQRSNVRQCVREGRHYTPFREAA